MDFSLDSCFAKHRLFAFVIFLKASHAETFQPALLLYLCFSLYLPFRLEFPQTMDLGPSDNFGSRLAPRTQHPAGCRRNWGYFTKEASRLSQVRASLHPPCLVSSALGAAVSSLLLHRRLAFRQIKHLLLIVLEQFHEGW